MTTANYRTPSILDSRSHRAACLETCACAPSKSTRDCDRKGERGRSVAASLTIGSHPHDAFSRSCHDVYLVRYAAECSRQTSPRNLGEGAFTRHGALERGTGGGGPDESSGLTGFAPVGRVTTSYTLYAAPWAARAGSERFPAVLSRESDEVSKSARAARLTSDRGDCAASLASKIVQVALIVDPDADRGSERVRERERCRECEEGREPRMLLKFRTRFISTIPSVGPLSFFLGREAIQLDLLPPCRAPGMQGHVCFIPLSHSLDFIFSTDTLRCLTILSVASYCTGGLLRRKKIERR